MKDFFNRFNVDYFFQVPVVTKLVTVLLGFYLLVLGTTLVAFFFLRKQETPHELLAKKIVWTEAPVAVVGLFLVFARYEELNIYSWRFFQYLLLLVFVGVNVWLYFQYHQFQSDLYHHYSKKRKEKWLKKK